MKIKREKDSRIIKSFSILFIMLSSVGCREVIIKDGQHKIISRKIDNSLADSVLIYGKVVSVIDTILPKRNSRIWTDELTKDTYSDNKGLYNLKLPSGTYTINCKEDFGTDEFIETIKNISFLPNEKVEIYFYIGVKIE